MVRTSHALIRYTVLERQRMIMDEGSIAQRALSWQRNGHVLTATMDIIRGKWQNDDTRLR